MELVGKTLGKYRLVEELGWGGMAVVYRGYDTVLRRDVAVKVMLPHLARDKDFVRRFRREAETAAQLAHPNIVPVHDVGQEDGYHYFVMAYLSGKTLSHIIAALGALPPAQVIAIARQIAAALDYAHGCGLVHRDIKPANIMVDEGGQAVLTDFGIVRAVEGTQLTATGMTLGTPEYMAPEQASGEKTTAASDIYSLGIVVYEMLAGQAPFHATTPIAVMMKHINDPPPPLSRKNPAIPAAVEQVVSWALRKEPAQRPASASQFVAALQEAMAGTWRGISPLAAPAGPMALAPTQAWPQPAAPPPAGARRGLLPIARRGTWAAFPMWAWVLIGVVLLGAAVTAAAANWPKPGAPRPPLVATSIKEITPKEITPLPVTASQPQTVRTIATVAAPTAATMADSPTACAAIGQTWIRPTDGMVMVCVPAGEFFMGSSNDDAQSDSDEKPQHRVRLDAFWIDRTEVTVAKFRAFAQATGYQTLAETEGWGTTWVASSSALGNVDGANWRHPEGPGSTTVDGQPVVQLNYTDAQAYCAWVGGRVPTEAEWEKAARGPGGEIYPWGNAWDGSRLNYCDALCPVSPRDSAYDDGSGGLAPVGSYPDGASPYGALDMMGNAWEWVQDWYDTDYYGQSSYENPTGTSARENRLLRGGAWSTVGQKTRCAFRGRVKPNYRSSGSGVRCVVPISP